MNKKEMQMGILRATGIFLWVAAVSVFLVGPGAGVAGELGGLAGWEKGSEYNRYYDASEFDEFKGVVEEVTEVVPLPGMAPGVGLVVRDQDGDRVEVQLGPKSFVKLDGIGLRKGDKVKVKGVWAQFDGKDAFMASKVKKGENVELKVRRTKDGAPFWNMTPDEIAAETGAP